MLRLITALLLITSATAQANPWFAGNPEYLDDASETLARQVLQAHGGMQAMGNAESLKFSFFTKVVGGPTPFYSVESVDLATGNAYLEWPLWDATIALEDGKLWSQQWPMPMPAGFFIRLTTSFITLPWLMQADTANVGPVTTDRLPGDDIEYDVIRLTFDDRSPSIPGTYYEVFVDPESHLVKGVRFDINHPGMVANPNQSIGPNIHVFDEYRDFDGLLMPTVYVSYGRGGANGGTSNAYHFLWDLSLDLPFDAARLDAPEDATFDDVSMQWWQSSDPAAISNAAAIQADLEFMQGETK